MSSRTSRVVWDLIARDSASRTFARVGRSMDGLHRKGTTLGGALAAGFRTGALATAGLGASVIKMAGDFEKNMNRVEALSGATGSQLQMLRDQAKELGRSTQYGAAQSADAMAQLATAGLNVNQIYGAMPSVLSLASSEQLDLTRAAEIATNVLTGYGMKIGEIPHAVDAMVKASVKANTSVDDLGEAFKYSGPIAHMAGIKFEEAAAATALMGNAGIKASMAGTALRGAVTRLLSPTDKITETLKDLGVKVTDTSGKLKPLHQIVGDLAKAGASTGDIMTIFGQRAGPGMAALIQQGSNKLVDLTKELENSGGTADRIAKIQMKGWRGEITRLKNAWEGLMIELGDTGLLSVATKGLEGVTRTTHGLTDFIHTTGVPLLDQFRKHIEGMVPVGGIGKKLGEAKQLVTDFFKGFAAQTKPKADKPLFTLPSTPGILARPKQAEPLFKAPSAPGILAQPKPAKSQAEAFGEQIRTAISDGLENIDWSKVGASVGSGLGKAFQWVIAHGAELTKKLGVALGSLDWVDIGKQFGKIALPTAIGFVNNLFEPMFHKEFWKKHWLDTIFAVISVVPFGRVFGVVGKIWNKIPWGRLFEMVGVALKRVPWGKIIPFGEKIATATVPILKAIGGLVAKIAVKMGEAIATHMPGVALRFGKWLLLLPLEVAKLSFRLSVRAIGAITKMGETLISHIPGMSTKVGQFLIKSFTRFSLYQVGINLAKSMLSGIGNALADLGSWLKANIVDPVVNGVKSLFGIHSPSTVFMAIGAALVAGLRAGLFNAAKGLGPWVWGTVGRPAVDAFRGAGSWLYGKGGSLVGGLKAGVFAAAKGIGGWMWAHVGAPQVGAFRNAGSWLASKGGSLISGLKNGMLGQMKGIGGWIKGSVVDPIVGAVKHFFGIKSPSRVFMSIGGHLVSGLMKGMARTNGTSIAKKIFGSMPKALAAIAKKGLVSLTSLPGRALKALGSLGGDVLGLLGLGSSGGGSSANQKIGQVLAAARGWSGPQWAALKNLWNGESGWNHLALNKSSGAYGIPQSLPASKMASAGSDWRTNPATQIKWGLSYIASRYGNPLSAYSAWLGRSPHWYDAGGVARGTGYMAKNTLAPERVLSPRQTVAFERLVDLLDAGRMGGGTEVRVFIGNEEITDRVKATVQPMIKASEDRTAFRAKVGRR